MYADDPTRQQQSEKWADVGISPLSTIDAALGPHSLAGVAQGARHLFLSLLLFFRTEYLSSDRDTLLKLHGGYDQLCCSCAVAHSSE